MYLLSKHSTPEQITGRFTLLEWKNVPSIETIYKYIYKNKRTGSSLYKALSCRKTYRKRSLKSQDKRGSIKGRIDINCRPSIIEESNLKGDYDGDTVVGEGHQGVIVTLVDRTTRESKN